MKAKHVISLLALSAAGLILSFPGFDVHVLAWISLAPLLIVIKRSGSLGAFLSAFAVGLCLFGALLSWNLRIDGITLYNLGLVVAVNAMYMGLFGLFARYSERRLLSWNVVTYPSAWVVLEYARSHLGFVAFPWGILGYSQYAVFPVSSIAAFTGVYGVSFLIMMVNTVVADIISPWLLPPGTRCVSQGDRRTRLKIAAGIVGGTIILFGAALVDGISYLRERERGSESLKIALIQGNVTSSENSDTRYREEIFEKYHGLTSTAAADRPDLIVWPSSSVPGKLPYDRILAIQLSGLARETRSYLLFGSSGYDKFNAEQRKSDRLANSAFLLTSEGQFAGRYDKIRLLPFDEYLPLRDRVKWPSWIVSPDLNDAGKGKFGVLICWENLFPDLFRKMAAKGVDFMVSMTNEGFTDAPAAHYQMLAMNVFRAIENRVSIVRTASTGVSAIIEPSGRIVSRVQDSGAHDVNVEGFAVGRILLSKERSFYTRHGDWFVYALSGIVVWVIFKELLEKYLFLLPSIVRSRKQNANP
jgi:apolipoprotein N-acyltransferase